MTRINYRRMSRFMAIFLTFLFLSLQGSPLGKLQKAKLAFPNGELFQVYLAITDAQQTKGLSGVKKNELPLDQGMLFLYRGPGPRSFWMPDTYFNLDIIYFNQEFVIKKIDHNIAAHPGLKEPPRIARLGPVFSHHVLEVHAGSKLAKKIKKAKQLRWMGKKTIKEILQETRPKQ